MKKALVMTILGLASVRAIAQKDAVSAALAKYQVQENLIFDEKLRAKPEDYAYDLKETVTTEGRQKVILASYDPSKAEAERWTVISADDQDPSTTEIKRFRKEHGKAAVPPMKIDESTYKIEKEEGNALTISYQFDPASLVEDNAFIKDFRVYLTVNTLIGKITKVETVNEKPFKIKTFNVPTLNTYSELAWSEADKRYMPKKDNTTMVIKILGQKATTVTILEYSNFKK
ncbi:M61 family metallopeptidase [Dyadobacter pollutisoli]|uniref:Peptidase M61 N-terminal domain-containing protein n=1 Tax=Dyadobacter pollutisoli TaxID=2910158 RepID=A0A9E8SID9_9BACT|nr:hypothetical protein [Dyadobacter pollutisoli]WAC10080.1 hypothetical protein ON006_20245 [Dyadobacter pollutisoli]